MEFEYSRGIVEARRRRKSTPTSPERLGIFKFPDTGSRKHLVYSSGPILLKINTSKFVYLIHKTSPGLFSNNPNLYMLREFL